MRLNIGAEAAKAVPPPPDSYSPSTEACRGSSGLQRERPGPSGEVGKKAHRQMTFSWTEHVGQLTEEEFKLRYRFTFEGFYQLLDTIRDDLLVHDLEQTATAKWGRVVEPETKLAIALRYTWQVAAHWTCA